MNNIPKYQPLPEDLFEPYDPISHALPVTENAGGGETRVVNGKTGGEKGSKQERWDLLPMDQLAKVARLYAAGANKYADHNWRKGYDWSLSIAALYRHMSAFVSGEMLDAETGCEHLSSVVFHALALLWFAEAHPDLDDRYVQ